MYFSNQYLEICLEGPGSLFSELSPKEKETVSQHHIVAEIRKGEFLFTEGEKTKGLVILVSGKAKVFRTGVGGREHILRMLKINDVTGFQSLFGDSLWHSTSVAIENSVMIIIDTHCIGRMIKDNTALMMKVAGLLNEELELSYNKMMSLTQKHVRGRIAESLLMLGDLYGFDPDGNTLAVNLSRNDIAHLSNMTTSNAIRTLSSFSAEGIIKIKGRKISFLNRTLLERISNQA